MNRNQLIFLLLILAVVGSAGLILVKRKKESWDMTEARMGDKVFAKFQPNEVAAIHIKGNNELHLVHQGDLWRVRERNDYPANFHQISDTLIKLKDLKVVEADKAGPTDLGRVNLDEPGHGPASGTLVEFMDAQGNVINSLFVGKKHLREGESTTMLNKGEADGCYILLPSDPTEVLLISDPLGNLQPSPEAWLNKDFFKVEKPKSISLTATNTEASWTLTRDNEKAAWTLADAKPGESLDAAKAGLAGDALIAPRFTDIAPASSVTLDNPTLLRIDTFDGFSYTMKIGQRTPDGNCYMTVAVAAPNLKAGDRTLQEKFKQEQALAPWVYLVGSWIVDSAVCDRSQLMVGSTADNIIDKPRPARATNELERGWTPRVIQ